MKRERSVCRKRPGSGGPDERVYVAAKFAGIRIRGHGKFHPNRRAGVIFVFDLGFSKGSAIVDAPIDWLEASVHIALFKKGEEGAGNAGLVIRVHRQVGLFPLPEDAQAFEFAAVRVNVPRSKLATHAAKFRGGNFALAAQ